MRKTERAQYRRSNRRASDHAINIAETMQKMNGKGLSFTQQGIKELDLLAAAVRDIINITAEAFAEGDTEKAVRGDELDMHQYVDVEIKGSDPFFRREYRRIKSIYILP